MIDDPTFYLLAVPAVLIVGISKAGFGGGIGTVSVPLMALAVPPTLAVAVLAPILCVIDLFIIAAYRGQWDWTILRLIVPAAFVGIGLGALTYGYLDEAAIRLIVGLLALGFALAYWRRELTRGALAPRPHNRAHGAFWGVVSGYTSFVAHAGGAPVNIYLLSRRLDKTVYQATTVIFFIAINYTKLIPYAMLDQFTPQTLATSLVLLPAVPFGVWLGLWLHRRVPEARFYRLCYLFLLIAGIKLIIDGGALLS